MSVSKKNTDQAVFFPFDASYVFVSLSSTFCHDVGQIWDRKGTENLPSALHYSGWGVVEC